MRMLQARSVDLQPIRLAEKVGTLTIWCGRYLLQRDKTQQWKQR